MKFGGGGVMVWGAISARGTGMLKTITGTLNSEGYLGILRDYLIPTAHMLGYGACFYLQDDGAPCHRSRLVTDWKSEQTFQCLIWPPQSPDLNPIENVWADMKRHLCNNPQGTKDDLEREIRRYWDTIGMPARIRECLAAAGGHTRY